MVKPKSEAQAKNLFRRHRWASQVREGDQVRVLGDETDIFARVNYVGERWIGIEGFPSKFSRTTGKYWSSELNLTWEAMIEVEDKMEIEETGQENGHYAVESYSLYREIQKREVEQHLKAQRVARLIAAIIELSEDRLISDLVRRLVAELDEVTK